MSATHLLAVYVAAGAVAAFVVARRTEGSVAWRLASACVAWLVWPLWAPVALGPPDTPRRASLRDPRITRLHAALDEVLAAAAGSPYSTLLSAEAATRIRAEIDRAAARIDELTETLERSGSDPATAQVRLERLQASGAHPRAIATARLHRDGVSRLVRVRDGNQHALEEMGDALEALRSHIVLARLAGSGGNDIVSDLWARVEGLGEAFREDDDADSAANAAARSSGPVPTPEEEVSA